MTFKAWASILDRWPGGHISAADLEDWLGSALQSLVAHVQRRSVFYSARLKTVDAAQLSLRNIESLPFTAKEDLREAMFDLLCGDVGDADFYFETIGTTGRPTPCPKAKIDFDLNYPPVAHALKAIVGRPWTAPRGWPERGGDCPKPDRGMERDGTAMERHRRRKTAGSNDCATGEDK